MDLEHEQKKISDEQFREFFSTSVAQVPEEMKRRQEVKKEKEAFFQRLFGKKEKELDVEAMPPLPAPDEIGELTLEESEPELPAEEPAEPELTLEPLAAEEASPAAEPEEAQVLTGGIVFIEPVEIPAIERVEVEVPPMDFAPEPTVQPVEEPAAEEPQPELPDEEPTRVIGELRTASDEIPTKEVVAKAEPARPKPLTDTKEFMETPAPAPEAPAEAAKPAGTLEDTMSLPLTEGKMETVVEEIDPGTAGGDRILPPFQKEASEEEPLRKQEEISESLRQRRMSATVRCVLSGILALALLLLAVVLENGIFLHELLDPVSSPTIFMAVNLVLLLVAVGVSFPVLHDGIKGLFGEPTSDALPAVAAVAAVGQAVVAVQNADSYHAGVVPLTLMSGMAAALLFTANLGCAVRLRAVIASFSVMFSDVAHQGACRVTNKELAKLLSKGVGGQDSQVLLSRPVHRTKNFVEQSFAVRESERTQRNLARLLLVAGILCGVVAYILNHSVPAAVSAAAAMTCLGAPLASTLLVGVSSFQMQRAAGAVGAAVPGWEGMRELSEIDTVRIDADDLFTPECAELEDIRIFKGGRIDKAILYAASVLSVSCNTLSGLFRAILSDREDLLLPVKDLEKRRGLGFSAWCDHCRILIGTREMMEREGVRLPELAYEEQHSDYGRLQILYLAVSGNMYAMFVLRYTGGRNAANGLSILKKENIHVLVSCDDPTLTAEVINRIYRLPDGLVKVLNAEEWQAMAPAITYAADAPCCMTHLKSLASLTGGLKAASRARSAERFGTTVQRVSVWFSVVIGLLLAYSGNLGALPINAVLIYQGTWSALTLIVTLMKQR